MVAAQLADLPQRLMLEVSVPQRLSDESISQTCDMVAARVRFLLAQEFQRRSAIRLRARYDARAARKAARAAALDAAARRAEAEEAADQAAKAARRRVSQ